jgi:GNAT superfamily N-acetyltransferase
MSTTIRPANRDDAPVIVDFNRALARETEGKELDLPTLQAGVEACLTDSHKGRYFVAEAEGQVIGQLMITFEWSDWRNGWLWWIQSVYVRARWRRQGTFRSLFHHVHQLACASPEVVGLRLYVERANSRAQQTYQSLGMTLPGYVVFERFPL